MHMGSKPSMQRALSCRSNPVPYMRRTDCGAGVALALLRYGRRSTASAVRTAIPRFLPSGSPPKAATRHRPEAQSSRSLLQTSGDIRLSPVDQSS